MSNRRPSHNRRAPSLAAIASLVLILGLGSAFAAVIAYNAFTIRGYTESLAATSVELHASRRSARLTPILVPLYRAVDLVSFESGRQPTFDVQSVAENPLPLLRAVELGADLVSLQTADGAGVTVARSDAEASYLLQITRLVDGEPIAETRVVNAGGTALPDAAADEPEMPAGQVDWMRDLSTESAALVRVDMPLQGETGVGVGVARRIPGGDLAVLATVSEGRVREALGDSASPDLGIVFAAGDGSTVAAVGANSDAAADAFDRYRGGALPAERTLPLVLGGSRYLARVEPVMSGQLVFVEPLLPITDDRTVIVSVAVGAAVAVLAIVVGILLLGRVGRILRDLTRMAGSIQRLVLDGTPRFSPKSRELSELNSHMDLMRSVLRALTRYVPRTLVQQFLDSSLEPELGGTWRDVSVMFTAIRGFTSVSEKENPGIVFLQLSEYFHIVGRAIRENNGIIDKFIGDAIMALWNASIDNEKHQRQTLLAALAIRHMMSTVNELWEENNQPRFESRIGLHSGSALVGNIGNEERLEFTAMGATVNLAARLEAMNKHFDTDILVSKDILDGAGPGFISRQIGIVRPRGSDRNMEIFELVGAGWEAPEASVMAPMEDQQKARKWNEILPLFYERRWKEMIPAIDAFLGEFPGDRVAMVYLDLATKYLRKEPGRGWHGVLSLR